MDSTSTAHRRWLRLLAVVLASCALLSGCLLNEPTDPGPLRFRDPVFSGTTKTTDITYAQVTSQTGQPVTLRLDLYQPTGDTAPRRPLYILAFGGSFKWGDKSSPELVDQANALSKKGYVVASINYRVSPNGCTSINAECLEAIVDATEDAQSAVRWFRLNADTYRIDPDRIAIGGTSAGAITAMNVGFGADVPGNGQNLGPSSAVQASVALSGARLLGTCDRGDAPSLLFHGDKDTLVPYQWAVNTVDCAKKANLWSHLETWPGEGHVPYLSHRDQIIGTTTTFLFNALDVRPLI